MYRRYRGFKWYSKRDAAYTAAIVVVVIAVIFALNALGLHDNPKGEFAPADDNHGVVAVEYGEVSK